MVASTPAPVLDATVAQLVTQRPSRSRVFQTFGIDFCCGGKITLEAAARRKGLDPQVVLGALLAAEQQADTATSGPDPSTLSLAALCDHIEATHHAYLKTELPRLHRMLLRVAQGHGEHYPWMREALAVYEPFAEELWHHMVKEEQVLFPVIRKLEAGQPPAEPGGGTLANPVRAMEHEHEDAGAALAKLRELTGGYTPPQGACTTFRATLDGLAELERDMHEHVHKENNVLFPRALRL